MRNVGYMALAVLFLLIGLLIGFNLDFFGSGVGIAREAVNGNGNVDLSNVWKVTALLFWAFLGWENLSFSLGEIKDPEKNVPLLYWLSFALVTSIYILLALISSGASAAGVPLRGAAGLSGLVLFTPGGDLLVWLMVIVVAANACSWNFTASRLLYSGGRTGIFPAVFGKLSKRDIPVSSLVGLYVLSIILIIGSYFFKIPVSAMILLVNQNFVFLYAFIIVAYWKTETGWRKWVFSALSLISVSFLVSGFTWEVVYPIFLVGFGYYRFLGKKRPVKTLPSGKDLPLCEDPPELPCLNRH